MHGNRSKDFPGSVFKLCQPANWRWFVRFAYADIYLYDSLSSGAGYCAQIGEMVVQLLQNTQNLLHQCDCRSACQNCLKHYQNQRIQMHLDRFSALKLLYYGQTGTIPAPLTIQKQHEAVRSFSVLFEKQGISLELSVPITITKGLIQKELIIQHAMGKRNLYQTQPKFLLVKRHCKMQSLMPWKQLWKRSFDPKVPDKNALHLP